MTTGDPHPAPDAREQRSVLVATGISAFLGPFMGSALNLAVPLVGEELEAPAVMSAVPRQQYGVGSATLSTMRVVGQALSMALVALILGHHMGQRALGPDAVPELLASTRVAFALFSALCVVGLLASLARGRLR